MGAWQQLLAGAWRRPSCRIAPLDSGHAREVARLHADGGFSRGWDTSECAALLAERAIVAEGVFQGRSEQLCGFILLRRAVDEAEILSIVIAPSVRRLGQGQALLKAGLGRLAGFGVRSVFLEVAETNEAAVGLYKAQDFRVVGQRHGYYPQADGTRATALVMRCDLP